MKKNALWIVLGSVFLVVFNIIFFVSGSDKQLLSVWISYSFIHAAYLMFLCMPYGKSKRTYVFDITLFSISFSYFIVELLTGIAFIIISSENYKPSLFVQLSIAGIYAVVLVSHLIANKHSVETEGKRQYEIDFIKTASAKLQNMTDSIKDKGLSGKIEKVYDVINSSPVKSYPDLYQTESQILIQINELEDAVSAGDHERITSLTDSLLTAANGRNRQLKVLNIKS